MALDLASDLFNTVCSMLSMLSLCTHDGIVTDYGAELLGAQPGTILTCETVKRFFCTSPEIPDDIGARDFLELLFDVIYEGSDINFNWFFPAEEEKAKFEHYGYVGLADQLTEQINQLAHRSHLFGPLTEAKIAHTDFNWCKPEEVERVRNARAMQALTTCLAECYTLFTEAKRKLLL
jgi:hypothetical protein